MNVRKCFIVCPIGEENSPTRTRSDKLLRHIITPVCEACGYETIRVDKVNHNESITEKIINYLEESDLVIADVTDVNPNVFFEIGYRKALGRHIIHLSEKTTKLPFDIATINTFPYDLNDLDSVEQLRERLTQTINALNYDSIESIVKSKSYSENLNTQILSELFKIQDSIKKLSESISYKDNSALSVLADKLVNTSSSSIDSKLTETMLKTVFDDPDKLFKFVEIANKINKK
jgi:nucleoside 2-deoxyribosyltransferase